MWSINLKTYPSSFLMPRGQSTVWNICVIHCQPGLYSITRLNFTQLGEARVLWFGVDSQLEQLKPGKKNKAELSCLCVPLTSWPILVPCLLRYFHKVIQKDRHQGHWRSLGVWLSWQMYALRLWGPQLHSQRSCEKFHPRGGRDRNILGASGQTA